MLYVSHGIVFESFEVALDRRFFHLFFAFLALLADDFEVFVAHFGALVSVLATVSEAEPAELVLALTASHVHASLILFNWTFALRAGFAINLEPVV